MFRLSRLSIVQLAAFPQLDALTADIPDQRMTPRLRGIETGRIIAWYDHGVTERLSQHGVDVLNGARGQARAAPAAAGGQLAAELRNAGRGDGLEPQVADVRRSP